MSAAGPRVLAAPKPGYLYVLEHPSHPGLYKIGKTTRPPEARLAEHNSNSEEYTGRIVKETGQKWTLKTFIKVADTTLAESVFWGHTSIADIPFLGSIEVHNLEWAEVQKAPLSLKSPWHQDGPLIRVKFLRKSARERITLVLDPDAPEVRSLWAVMEPTKIEAAAEALRAREEVPTEYAQENIGRWTNGSPSPASIPDLSEWARTHG
jgi:hypothetical protein